MGKLRDTMSAQDLALHDSHELLPESAKLVEEDIRARRLVISTASQTAIVLADEPSE